MPASAPVAALIDPNPYLAYARIADLLHPQPKAAAGIHATAVVAPGARIDLSASIGPLAVIEDDVDIGARVTVGAGCSVGRGAHIGEDSWLNSRITIYHGVRIAGAASCTPERSSAPTVWVRDRRGNLGEGAAGGRRAHRR